LQGGSVGDDPSLQLTCELKQLPPNMPCDTSSQHGWCYVEEADSSKGCAQEILFSKDALRAGVTTSLQCLEASTGIGGGDAAAPAPAATTTPTGDAGH
jgi:hypothetical protein